MVRPSVPHMLTKEPITQAKTRSLVSERAQDATMRQVRRELAVQSFPYFMSYYLRDDNGDKFKFKEFHIEMMEAYADEGNGRVLALEPASFGKSTILKGYMVWQCIKNPDVKIALIGKTFDDATKRLRTIKAELESNKDLIDDFGPFRGDVWKEDQITVAARTTNAKEPNISCAGGESNVMGWRSDIVVLDDIVTNDNSGPQVKPESRERLKDNFTQGFLKLGVVGEISLIRWVNTVVDKRDLTHEIGRLKDHPDMGDTRWMTPEGWLVLRRSSLNETTGALLWPERYPLDRPPLADGRPDPRPSVQRDRLTDPLMFEKRMQNRCVEEGLMPFQQVWIEGNHAEFPGCLDTTRHMRDVPKGWTTAAGFDPAGSVGAKSDWCAHIVVAFDKTVPTPVYQIIWIDRGRWGLEDQQQKVVDEHRFFNVSKTKVEANAAQQWFVSSGVVRKAATDMKATPSGPMRIEPHYTTDQKFHVNGSESYGKPDPEYGIPSLGNLVKAGLIRFPTGDSVSLERSQWLISEMIDYLPSKHSGDLLMALWFAILAARESEGRKMNVIHRPLPQWAAFGRVN